MSVDAPLSGTEIAIIGMAGRFPGANSVQTFWENLLAGKEALQHFSDETLLEAGIPSGLLHHPDFVKAGMPLEDIAGFDPGFFGYTPKEAALMDPQHRLLLEVAWESLENSGYVPEKTRAALGVFVGCGTSHYDKLLLQNRQIMRDFGGFELGLGVNPTHLATRIAYKLNLKGPAITLATACSTSLAAVHLGCQSLLNLESDVVLAGGVSLKVPQKGGYRYHQGGILSPDGHCRAFDAQANGTAGGNGAAMVVLRRLEDALEAGDHVVAVIKGSALNNDGHEKAGYVAPSVQGQAAVIREALAVAEVPAETIGFVEAHGTGTTVGDPIEVTALARAFDLEASEKTCVLGSVKTHIGHLDAAAGVAGLIKAALTLKHAKIAPTLHFEKPNPLLKLEETPFWINNHPIDWPQPEHPRRAGVSSFGIGGTNAHVVLEEAPETLPKSSADKPQLLLISAKTRTALNQAKTRLAEHLNTTQQAFDDIAFTLAQGRADFPCRDFLVASDIATAYQPLTNPSESTTVSDHRELIFLLSGQGSEYVGMGGFLYNHFSHFRNTIQSLAPTAAGHLGNPLVDLFRAHETAFMGDLPTKNAYLFSLSYALGRLFMYWGLKPQAMLGLSLGEYVAASLAEAINPNDALGLVIRRAQCMATLPPAKVLSVAAPAGDLTLPKGIDLTIHSAPDLCVIAGPADAVTAFQKRLEGEGIRCMQVAMDRAFHSSMTHVLKARMMALCHNLKPLSQPAIPYFSNVTGALCSPAEWQDPAYWYRHLSQPVTFAKSVAAIPKSADTTFLEVGPGATVSKLVQRQRKTPRDQYLASLPRAEAASQGMVHFLETLGKLWTVGFSLRWDRFFEDQTVGRVPLPSYCFQRQRYWVTPDDTPAAPATPSTWFYREHWQCQTANRPGVNPTGERWLWLDNATADPLSGELTRQLGELATQKGVTFECGQIDQALASVLSENVRFDRILLNLTFDAPSAIEPWLTQGYLELANICRLREQHTPKQAYQFIVITQQGVDVSGLESVAPGSGLISAALRVLGSELSHVRPRQIDVPRLGKAQIQNASRGLLTEILRKDDVFAAALRGHSRWVPTFSPLHLGEAESPLRELHPKGIYLVTGGLGRIGHVLAMGLAQHQQAKIAIMGRKNEALVLETPQWQQLAKAVESLGGEARYFCANCAELEAVRSMVTQIENRWGPINGVFHTAATTKGPALTTMISAQSKAIMVQQLESKYQGTRNLCEIFSGKSLDFLLAFSSNAGVLGRSGYGAYAAANRVMDMVIHQYSQQGYPFISASWDGWYLSQKPMAQTPGQALLIDPESGGQAIAQILNFAQPGHLIVSRQPLQPRVTQWLYRRPPKPTIEAPAIARDTQSTKRIIKAPENPMQAQFLDLWCDLLGLEDLSIDDSFFELGGHSLLGLQLINRISETTGIQLSLQQLFANPTPAKLATCAQADLNLDALPPITPHPDQTQAPLSLSQRRLWFMEKLLPVTSLYHMPFAVQLTGALQPHWLNQSLVALFEIFPDLLTAIDDSGEAPLQRRISPSKLPISWLDFSCLTDPLNHIHQHLEADNQHPFDLVKGPLVRIQIFRLGPEHHVFYLNLHHLIGDGWSIQVFIETLLTQYHDLHRGQNLQLQRPACNYFDFAWWQQTHLEGTYLENQRHYWQEQFEPLPHPLQLPFDFPAPKVLSHHGAIFPFALERETYTALQDFSNTQGLTLFMTLLGVFKILLYRYTNQTDLVVGTPISNRHHPQTQHIFGLFANTLALRSQLDSQGDVKTFTQFCKDLRQTVLAAHEHQDVPFEQIVQILELQRDASRSPLFQAMFALAHHSPIIKMDDEWPLQISPLKMKADQAKFELTLSLVATDSSLAGHFEYNTDLFHPETIRDMTQHFQTLAKQLLNHATVPVSRVPISPCSSSRPLPGIPDQKQAHQSFSQQLEHVVARQPQAPALRLGGQTLSYGALQNRVDRLVCLLQQFPIGPERVVAVAMERGDLWLASMLAVFKTGSIYLPLDPNLPTQRRNFMLEDAGAQLLIGLGSFQDLPPSIPLFDPSQENQIVSSFEPPPALPFIPEQGAYLIYTSGTTGRPKAVCISQAAMHHHQQNMMAAYQLTAQDRVLQLCSSSFDVSLEEVLPSLLAGACLVMIPNTREWDLKTLTQYIGAEKVSVVNAPTALWHAWVEAMAYGEIAMPACLRLQIVGTEAASPKLLEQWRQQLEHPVTWVNAYGPTEATVTATLFSLDQAEPLPADQVPIGRSLKGMTAYLLGDHLQPMPTPAKGWLYLSGPQLARGYWGQPAQTASTFLPDPFSQLPGARMYQTGDRCWRQRNSRGTAQLAFAGRRDHQVKIRGHRIELEEVNHCLSQAPGVNQSLVVHQRQQKHGRLVAYIVMHTRAGLEQVQTQLTHHLTAHLPSYMVPDQFVFLENMPLTAAGKIDRSQLPSAEQTTGDESKQPPRNPEEKALCQIFSEVLGREVNDVHADFFSLGGHSLLAIKLLAMLEKSLGLQLPLAALFEQTTVASLAKRLTSKQTKPSPLIALRMADTNVPPLVLVHPVGGNLLCYKPLIDTGAFPHVWGFQAFGLAQGEIPLDDLDIMARTYTEALQHAFPQGPYHLAGWSMGGILALKMAAQLGASASVFLIDSYAPQSTAIKQDHFGETQLLAAELSPLFGHHQVCQKTLASLAPDKRQDWLLAEVVRVNPAIDLTMLRRMVAVLTANNAAFSRGRVERFNGRVLLFEGDALPEEKRASHTWQQLLPHLTSHTYQGGHYDWFKPHNLAAIEPAIRHFFREARP